MDLQRTADLFSHVYSITEPIILQALDSSDEMDVDSMSKDHSSKLLYNLQPLPLRERVTNVFLQH